MLLPISTIFIIFMNVFLLWWLDAFNIQIYFKMKLCPYCMEPFIYLQNLHHWYFLHQFDLFHFFLLHTPINAQLPVSTLEDGMLQEAASVIFQCWIIFSLLIDIEFVMMKTCLYTYYRYTITKIRNRKCDFMSVLNFEDLNVALFLFSFFLFYFFKYLLIYDLQSKD